VPWRRKFLQINEKWKKKKGFEACYVVGVIPTSINLNEVVL